LVTVLLLGTPQILLDDRPLHGLRRKNRALVYYLAAYNKPVTRNQTLNLFWPDHERPAAQHILRTMLHALRKHIGNALQAEDDFLLLRDVAVDTRTFQTGLNTPASHPGPLNSTLALYRGDFLQDFTLPDTPAFDDWLSAERERYRLLAIRGLAHLSRLHEQQRSYTAALDAIERALAFDLLQEDLQRDALRLHYLAGDRTGAIRRYDTLVKLLDQELGVPPMAETRALYDAIISDTPGPLHLTEQLPPIKPIQTAPSPSPAISPAFLPFTGRAAQMRMLQVALSPGKLILIEGEPGIGKTRLVEEFLASWPQNWQQRPLILRGTAYETEQGLPYQPLADALRALFNEPEWPILSAGMEMAPAWLAEVTRLVPELAAYFPGTPAPLPTADESRLWESMKQFFLHLARQRPVLLFVDDLHWADTATQGLLGYLARRSASSLLFLMATARSPMRDSQLARLLQTLRHENRLERLSLLALTEADSLALARHFSSRESQPLFDWLVRHAEGNPYFLTELLRYAFSAGLLTGSGEVNEELLSWTPVLPPTIQNLILSRLVRLSEDARRILELAAVVGSEFSAEVVAQASLLPENTLMNGFDELQVVGLIQPCENEFKFDHSLTMEVIYQQMGPIRRSTLHRQIGEALEALYTQRIDSVAGSLAYHFTRAKTAERAAPYAFRAGKRAAALAAWAEAITFYEQALEEQVDDLERAAIFLALGTAHFHSGNFAAATDTLYIALDLAKAGGDLSAMELAHVFLTQSLLPQARYPEAIGLAEELRRNGPPELAISAEFNWGTGLGVQSAYPAQAELHLREAQRLLERLEHDGVPNPSHVTLALIKYQLVGVLSQQGKYAEAVTQALEALHLAEADDTALDLLRRIMVYNHVAHNLNLLADPAAADYARRGIQLAREKGSLSHLPYLLSTSGEIALSQNHLDEAEAFFQEGLTIAEQIPVPERIAGLTANLGLIALRRGQQEQARQRLFSARKQADALGARHLVVRICLWLAPLLPAREAFDLLNEARAIALTSGFEQLVKEVIQLETELPASSNTGKR
jgi:DNA-binding SARP family transcriptional activator